MTTCYLRHIYSQTTIAHPPHPKGVPSFSVWHRKHHHHGATHRRPLAQLLPTLSTHRLLPKSRRPSYTSHRTFLTPPTSLFPLQTLSASRTLPYSASAIFNLIADIDEYPQFIPYCTSSQITSLSPRVDSTPGSGRRWPRTSDLHIGYGPYSEVFRSKVYCAPFRVLEAVSGEAECGIEKEELQHYLPQDDDAAAGADGQDNGTLKGLQQGEGDVPGSGNGKIFQSLLTRWEFKELPLEGSDTASTMGGHGVKTEVNLVIEVRFANPVYSALSQAAAPKVAGMMVEAFEKRAKEVLGKSQTQIQSG